MPSASASAPAATSSSTGHRSPTPWARSSTRRGTPSSTSSCGEPRGGDRHEPIHAIPSDDVPALPPFTFEIPDGWTADTVPGALCAVAAPAAADGYRTNVIVEITRCPTTIDLDAMVVETTNDEPVLHTEAIDSAVNRLDSSCGAPSTRRGPSRSSSGRWPASSATAGPAAQISSCSPPPARPTRRSAPRRRSAPSWSRSAFTPAD